MDDIRFTHVSLWLGAIRLAAREWRDHVFVWADTVGLTYRVSAMVGGSVVQSWSISREAFQGTKGALSDDDARRWPGRERVQLLKDWVSTARQEAPSLPSRDPQQEQPARSRWDLLRDGDDDGLP